MSIRHIINLDRSTPSPMEGHLRMGGANPAGEWIGANSQHLLRGGQPWTPVMGEIHFSRLPRTEWRDALLKMKAGGIQIAATYIFWNHHEETQGVFDWSDNRDLRGFILQCAEAGLEAYPRIGPWAHGEVRRGGFPDWLVEQCAPHLRVDDPAYLGYAKILYEQISTQLAGLLWKDGGPVIGLQIENELADRPDHLLTLKNLARQAGLDVPLYTMTGWGPALVPQDELIPVFGGYPDAPWDRQHAEWARDSRKHYFFSPLRDDNTIGADLGRKPSIPDQSHLERYPYGTCELGGGVQVTYHRRPQIDPQDVAAIPFCKLGAGANLLGYYMYHGGTNPNGMHTTLQESQNTGYPNDLPVCSYDFQAPLGEYGQARPHFHALRSLHLFMHDFGAQLAPLAPHFPQPAPASLDDRQTLRWAVRGDSQHGFLFVNNYQRIEALPEQAGVQFELRLTRRALVMPSQPFTLQPGVRLLWPFGLQAGGLTIAYASANLICRLDDGGPGFLVFAANQGVQPELAFLSNQLSGVRGPAHQLTRQDDLAILSGFTPGTDCLFEVSGTPAGPLRILVLDHTQVDQLYRFNLWGQQRLLLSPALLHQDGNILHLRTQDPANTWVAVYPSPQAEPASASAPLQSSLDGVFTRTSFAVAPLAVQIMSKKMSAACPAAPALPGPAGVAQAPAADAYERGEIWEVSIPPAALDGSAEIYLQIDYTGDAARAYLDGELIADDFWYGRTWEIGLRRHAARIRTGVLRLFFLPLHSASPIYLPTECAPVFDANCQALQVRQIRAVPEIEISWPG